MIFKAEASHFSKEHGLPNVHKQYTTMPSFRPIIDTTGTPHYNAGTFLANVLNSLASDEFSLSDSFWPFQI